MEKQKNIPKLRFPEFEGEWEKKRLGEVAEINVSKKKLPDEFIYIDLESVEHGELLKESLIIKSEAPSRAQRILKRGDILFQMVRPYQMNNFYFDRIGNYVASTGYAQIRTEISKRFLFQQLHHQKFVDSVIGKCTGTSYPAINSTDLSNIEVCLPELKEQQKMATFLTTVDEKLQALKKKKTLLEQYRKGVMQKIFSQELRFKEDNGEEFPEWEETTLREIAEKKNQKNKDDKVKNVFTNSAVQGIVNQRDFFDKDIANQDNLLNYYVIEKDDFIYNPRISVPAPVGPINRNHIGIGVMSPLYSVFRFKKGNLDFLEIFFSSTKWHEYMKGIANYGARADRMNILSGDFYEMPIPYPSLPEQTKIANFLTAIDEKINQCGKQIAKMEEWKKGLLQKMFV